MAIVKVHNKTRNITYVYESESYWYKELKQPRSHRKLIGRIDPDTGEIVPTSRKVKADQPVSVHSDTDYKALYERSLATIEKQDALIRELRSRISALESDNKAYLRTINKACEILTGSAAGKGRGYGQ